MRDADREARQNAIEAACYDLLAERGYAGTSMLAVARRAKASNETLYRWYGDKNGLLAAMVQRNVQASVDVLDRALVGETSPWSALQRCAPLLLAMVLGERAVSLNRAAAADRSGTLGRILAAGGRERIAPLIGATLARAMAAGEIAAGSVPQATELFITLLIGDAQIRRVIGSTGEPAPQDIEERAAVALARLKTLLAAAPPAPPA